MDHILIQRNFVNADVTAYNGDNRKGLFVGKVLPSIHSEDNIGLDDYSLFSGNYVVHKNPVDRLIFNHSFVGVEGYTVTQLACPTMANDTQCVDGAILYSNWDQAVDDQGEAVWNFGSEFQFPQL